MESVQRGVTVDTACNGVDTPSTAPCQGEYDLMAQFAGGKLEKECFGSFTPTKVSEEAELFEILSNCEGGGNSIVSVEGDILSMTTIDSCSTNETMYASFGSFDTDVLGAFVNYCVGNSTSTQHFAEAEDT